jgi:hypothetical protein
MSVFFIPHFLAYDKRMKMMAICYVVSMLRYCQQQQRLLLQLQQKTNLDASMDMMDKLMDEMSVVDNMLM